MLGSPIDHSLSPVLHRAAYRELGLDWQYDAVDVTEDGLAGFLGGLGARWRGLSLTMPLKRAVLPLLDDMSETTVEAGAANTVLLDDRGRRFGHNTDVPGMRQALQEQGVSQVRSATVVGGGATATSAVLALAGLGLRDVALRVREPGRARETVEAAGRLDAAPRITVARLDEPLDPAQPVDVVVSTVPAEAQAEFAERLVALAGLVFDVIYDPWPTPLALAAEAAGRTVVGGLDLLVHQATRQVELMTGLSPAPLETMRAAGQAALQARRTGAG